MSYYNWLTIVNCNSIENVGKQLLKKEIIKTRSSHESKDGMRLISWSEWRLPINGCARTRWENEVKFVFETIRYAGTTCQSQLVIGSRNWASDIHSFLIGTSPSFKAKKYVTLWLESFVFKICSRIHSLKCAYLFLYELGFMCIEEQKV